MAFFRKKVKLNKIYVGIIGDMMQPQSQTWAIEILFPEYKLTSMKNKPKEALEQKNFDEKDFVIFLRAMVVSSVASLASWVHPAQFIFFPEVFRDEDLIDNFQEFFDLQRFGGGLVEALNTGNKNNIDPSLANGSSIYGRKSTMGPDQAQMFETATISVSYMIEYFTKHSPKIANSLGSDVGSSRDSLVDFFAHVVRYWNHLLKDIKPELS